MLSVNMTLRAVAVCLLTGIIIALPHDVPAKDEYDVQQIYSWKEKVRVYPSGLEFRAKLDSGALTSSLHALDIEEFERNNEDWVRFTIVTREGKKKRMERKIVRYVRIKEHGGTTQRRPVVKMGICLGRLYKEVEVNLVDRSNFTTGMLIGRSFMQDDVLIDPSTTYSHPPDCEREPIDE